MWLSVVLLITNLWALDPVSTAIEQAQSLALKKNRQAATLVLTQALDEGSVPPKGRAKLLETLANLSRVFFTDKGQKLFEAAQSSMYDTPDVALAHYREALTLEDGNILVLDNIARLQLVKQDCAGAAATLVKARALNAYAPEPALLELRTLICQKDFETFRERMKVLPALEKGQDAYVQFLLAQDLIQQKMWRKATEVLLKVNEEDPLFPEAYYLLTKTSLELSRDTDPFAEKYVSLCKGVTARTRKRFSLEPRLCANAKEVADELAKKKVDL